MCNLCSKCEFSGKLNSMKKNWDKLPVQCLVNFLEYIYRDCYSTTQDKIVPSDQAVFLGQMVFYLRSAAEALDYVLKNKHFKD